MSTFVERPKSNRSVAPAGTFPARCIGLIELGTHLEIVKVKNEKTGKMEEKTKPINKFQFSFELPTKTKVFKEGEPEKPIMVSKKYTKSMFKQANLRKFAEKMIGMKMLDQDADKFDVETLVGMPCLITIQQGKGNDGETYSYVESVTQPMEGVSTPDQVNKSRILTFSSWNQELFDGLHQFMKDVITSSDEYKKKFGDCEIDADEVMAKM